METKNLALYHIIRAPKVKKENPQVLFLFHGYGSNEQDLFSFAVHLPPELFIISARAPHPMAHQGYAWYAIEFDENGIKKVNYDEAKVSRNDIKTFIDQACEAYSLNTENISVLGFSQGAILSYALALSFPDKIKNIIALSGYLDTAILEPHYEKNNFENLQIYVSHGLKDQVIPESRASQAQKVLNALHIDYVYETFPTGHGVDMANFESFKNWIKARVS